MAKRGRISGAELSAVVVQAEFGGKARAPEELTARQKEIWQKVALTEPVVFFNTESMRLLLAAYCRHIESSEIVTVAIDSFKPEYLANEDGADRYGKLLKIRDQESRAAATCATKLRMTNQSRYTPQSASTASRNAPTTKMPWE